MKLKRVVATGIRWNFPALPEQALSRSWVLLVNRAWRFLPACLYFNALGPSWPSPTLPFVGTKLPQGRSVLSCAN
jgi:hypothetical protein